MPNQPNPFTLTEDEARALQGRQSEKQAQFAREGPVVRHTSIAVPLLAITLLLAVIWWGYEGDMPSSLYFGSIIAYLLGLFTYVLVMIRYKKDIMERTLHAVPQIFEQRRISIDANGLHQKTDTSDVTFRWHGIEAIEHSDDMVLFWIHKFSAIGLPRRAFATPDDASSFEDEARNLLRAQDGA